jgi:hypothetical protein
LPQPSTEQEPVVADKPKKKRGRPKKQKKKALNLTEEQLEQLKEREKTEQASRDSSLRNLYNTIWLLKMEDGKLTIEPIEVGGRALKETNIHERLMELLMHMSPPKVFDTLTQTKFLQLIKIEEGMEIKDIVDTFFSSPGFPRIVDENVIRKVISTCIKDGRIAITTKEKVRKVDDKITVEREYVAIGKEIPPEEIDISAGYVMQPEIMQLPKEHKDTPAQEETMLETKLEQKTPQNKPKHIHYTLKNVTREQLYKCFEAFGNLASMCGSIIIKIEVHSNEGIDKNSLRNAVEEPIEETGVTVEKEYEEE